MDLFRVKYRQPLDVRWIATEEVANEAALEGTNGIWLVPVGAEHNVEGAISAARIGREQRIPMLGTCSGLQYGLLEFARNVCGLLDATHAEHVARMVDPALGSGQEVIVSLGCAEFDRMGDVMLVSESRAQRLMGARSMKVRYRCNYGPSALYVPLFEERGLRIAGLDGAGQPRIAELPDHPFYLLTLFQPELQGPWQDPHPFIRAFIAAAIWHMEARER